MEDDSVGAHLSTHSSAESNSSAGKQDLANSAAAEAENDINELEPDFLIQQNTDSEEIGLNALITVAVNTIANSLIQSPDSFTEHHVSSFVNSVAELATKLKDVSQGNLASTQRNESVSHLNHPGDTSSQQLLYHDGLSYDDNGVVHHVKTETDSYLFACERCNFQTNVEKEMIRHIHSKLSRCDSNPNKKRKIVMHHVDSTIRTHNCSLCSYSATSEVNLRHHAKREHSNFPPPFICPDCSKTFVYSSDFRRHCIIHTDQRNHVCPICHLTFNRKSSLTAHVKRIHSIQDNSTPDRTNCCDECGKTFGTKGDLQRHVSGVHRNMKPYSCDKCEYRSDRNSNLMRHLLTKHGLAETREVCRNVDEDEVDVVRVDYEVIK